MDMQIILGMSGGIMAFVEWLKTIFGQIPFYAGLTSLQQSMVLQTVAFLAGIIAAFYGNINVFPSFQGSAGVIATGLLGAVGSAGIHIVYAWLGMRGAVTADLPVKAESVSGRATYAPFM